MPIQKLDVEEFLNRSEGFPILDVRSPGEYEHAHVPGAFSLPLFSDEERAVIGTAYKQQGREVAVKEGLEYFSSGMKNIREAALGIFSKSGSGGQPVFFIHCWRGGMRSEAVAWLLSLYGYKIFLLKGGYKSFRRWSLEKFEQTYHVKILAGYTGSGKTEILRELKTMGQKVIDLEALANHKGSAFGSLGMGEQPSQEMFENLLAVDLWKNEQNDSIDNIWMEDESRHIGRVHIPNTLWLQMRESPLYFIEIPSEKRLEFIVKQYGRFDKELLKESVLRIQKRLGGLDTKNAIQFLDEDDIKGCFEILLKYYDKLYGHSLAKHEEGVSTLHKIHSSDVDNKNALLL